MKTVVKTIHGSKLYGTDYAGSDLDYKVVFAHSLSGLVTGTDDCYRTHEPDDTEHFSLKKFALLLGQQQTNAIEILFTPKEFIVETSPAWEELRENRQRLVSKNIMPFVGYAKQQARVYSEKGHSLNMLSLLHSDMKRWATYHPVNDLTTGEEYTDGKYCSVELPNLCKLYPSLISRGEKLNDSGGTVVYYQVLDKQFECLVSFNEWRYRIETMINHYGERAKAAANEGAFDRKAMYHAIRIIDEATELLNTGELVFPRPSLARNMLREVRFDENCTFDMAQATLMGAYHIFMEISLPNSTLQEGIDKDYLDNWYKSTQMAYVKKELFLR